MCVTLAFVRAVSDMAPALRCSILALLPEICRLIAYVSAADAHAAATGSVPPSKKLMIGHKHGGSYPPFAVDSFMDSRFFRACSTRAPTPSEPSASAGAPADSQAPAAEGTRGRKRKL